MAFATFWTLHEQLAAADASMVVFVLAAALGRRRSPPYRPTMEDGLGDRRDTIGGKYDLGNNLLGAHV